MIPLARLKYRNDGGRMNRIVAAAVVLACVLAAAVWWRARAPAAVPHDSAPPADARFIGSAACAGCHVKETQAWRGSHHDLAMQEAGEKTVLGDFNDASFSD